MKAAGRGAAPLPQALTRARSGRRLFPGVAAFALHLAPLPALAAQPLPHAARAPDQDDLAITEVLQAGEPKQYQQVARMALVKRGGFEVRVCSSGAEALAAAPEFAPDLLLLDVMMPGLDGPATLQALRGLDGTAATSAIFMTAKVHPPPFAEYLALGAIGVIAKPFDAMALAETVRSIWAQHHGAPGQDKPGGA